MVLFTLEMLLGMVFNNIKHFKSKVVGQLKGIILHINKKKEEEKAAIDPHFSGKYIRWKQSLLIALIS